MRKKIRQVFALMLAVVMCVTVLPAMPAKAATPVKTLFSGVISSDRVNATGAAYYWKGDKVKLSVKAADNATVEWTSTDVGGNLVFGEDGTSGSSSGGYITHNNDLTITDSASGTYTITAKATSASGDTYQEITYKIEVQENDFVVLECGKNSNEMIYTNTTGFHNTILVKAGCEATIEQFEVTTAEADPEDEALDVITDNSVSIFTINESQKNTAKYPGCVEYQFLISPPSNITEGINKVALKLKATKDGVDSLGLVAKYWILERATGVSSFKVTSSNQPDNQDLIKYPHIDNRIIYMDSNETITIEGTVEGSATDLPRFALNDYKNFESISIERIPNLVEKNIKFIITLEGKARKSVDDELLKVTTLSGVSNEYKVLVYNVDDWHKAAIYVNGNDGSVAVYQDSNHKLELKPLDKKEEVKWSSSSSAEVSVTSSKDKSQSADLTASLPGTPTITAQVAPTPASSRKSMKKEILVSVSEVIEPTSIAIDDTKLKDTNYKLAQKAKVQISATALNAAMEPYGYPSSGYFIWKSSNPEVATIDSDGNITAKNPGTTIISVTGYQGKEVPQNKPEITVYAPAEKIVLKQKAYEEADPKEIVTTSYATGQKCILYADITPNVDGVEEIEWKNSNSSIAKIESHPSNNKIKYVEFIGTGSVTITANGIFNTNAKGTVTFNVEPSVQAEKINVTSGETINEKVWLAKGGSKTLTAVQTGAGDKTANDVLTWHCEPAEQNVVELSQDINGATVDVKAVGTGEVKIYAQNAVGVKSTPIVVKGVIYATSVNVTSVSGKKLVGYENTLKLKPTLSLGSTELTDLQWSSSDETKIDLVRDNDGKVIIGNDGSVEVRGINYTESEVTITAKSNNPKTTSGYIKLKVVNSIIDNCKIEPIADVFYTGSPIKPDIVVKNAAGEELSLGTHYTVTYKNNTDAGVASIKITGKETNGYVDDTTVAFKILPFALNADNATMADYTSKITYDGKEKKITPDVKVDLPGKEKSLSKVKDIEYIYSNNINAGTMTITAKGIGNYAGSISKIYTIEPKAVSSTSIALEKKDYEYEAGAITPKVTVKDGTELTVGKDYNISYSNNTNVSTGSDKPEVKITGIGNYTGEKVIDFKISTRDVSKLDDAYLKTTDYIYNGKAKKPKVVLAFNRENGTKVSLKAKRDYDLTYVNNKEKGIARATITGKGNYRGSLTLEFGIAEKVKVSRATIRSVKNSKKKRTVVTIKKVSGAAGYEVAYSLKKKFPKQDTKVKTTRKTTYTIKNLKKGKKYYFRVRAYKVNSIGRKVFGSWSKVKYVNVKR